MLTHDCWVSCHGETTVLAHGSSGRLADHVSMASIADCDSEFTSLSILHVGVQTKL